MTDSGTRLRARVDERLFHDVETMLVTSSGDREGLDRG